MRYGNPPHLVCFICDDDGLCRNNIFSPYYDDRLFGDTDYLDCIVYLRNKEDRPTENWIHGWLKFNKKKLSVKNCSLAIKLAVLVTAERISSYIEPTVAKLV